MKLWIRSMIFGATMESIFALCVVLGEEPDIDRGDIAGWIGLLGHLPVAFLAWLTGFQSQEALSWRILFGFVTWSVFWWTLLTLINSRLAQLKRTSSQE